MIEFVVNGIPYKDYIDANLTISIESMANDFSFTSSSVKGFPIFKVGDEVEVNIHDVKRFTGHIEELNGSHSEGSHIITYSGRDNTGDFIDSNVQSLSDIRPPIKLKTIIEALIDNTNSQLTVFDTVQPDLFNASEDLIDQEDGDGCIDIAREYARKRQCLLSSTAEGNILITQSEPTESGETLQSVKDGNNNIISQSWSVTTSELYNAYIFKSQLDTRTINLAGKTSNNSIVNQSAIVNDDSQRVGRQKVIVEGEKYSSGQLASRAEWDKNLSNSKSTRFNCYVKGLLKSDGRQWTINELVLINSDSADISRKMLLSTMTFQQGEGAPTLTYLNFVERDIFTIDSNIRNKKQVGKLNDGFKK